MMNQRTSVQGVMWAAAAALGAALVGCSGGAAPASAQGGGETKDPSQGLSYYRDVKPIVDQKCVGCHSGDGIAPFGLTSFAEVSAMKDAIGPAVSSGIMPPWPPAKDCVEYTDDRSLSDAQVAMLKDWIAAGAPEGDPSDAPPEVKAQGGLSRVDLTLELPEAFTPTISPDEYRCFVVDWPAQDTTYVTGLGVTPGTPAIVHHVIAFLATPDRVADYQALDAADPGPGYSCFGGPGAGALSWLGGWAPGAAGADFPAGTGIEVPPGSKVIMQVHYNTASAPPSADQTKLLLKTDATVDKKAAVLPWANPTWVFGGDMIIPAHTEDATHRWAYDPTPFLSKITGGVLADNQPFTLYSASLHMHTRGTRAVTAINRASSGAECLLDIERWDFHWQGAYGLVQPKEVKPGDQISIECHWNNPGAVDLNWGEGTGDEMCLSSYYVTQ
jgi:hypothetical protein